VCEKLLAWIRQDVFPEHRVTASVETVEVIRRDHFLPEAATERELQSAR